MISISCRILVDRCWKNIDNIVSDPGGLLEYYLNIDNLSCCSMQIGFFISIDGQAWNGPGTVDEYRNAESWFPALLSLLSGQKKAQVWAWEQSQLELHLKGRLLTLLDEPVCPVVSVDVVDFVGKMIFEGWKFLKLVEGIKAELEICKIKTLYHESEFGIKPDDSIDYSPEELKRMIDDYVVATMEIEKLAAAGILKSEPKSIHDKINTIDHVLECVLQEDFRQTLELLEIKFLEFEKRSDSWY